MSDSDESTPKAVLRTVTPPYRGRPDSEMSTIGFSIFLGLLVLLVPLLPFILIVWLLTKAFGTAKRRVS